MKKTILLALLVASGLTFQSCGSSEKKDSEDRAEESNEAKKTVDDDDAEFAVKAADGGMLEVELGRMAETKAQSQQVKDFGARMVTDHSKANDELKAIAANKNITLPTTLGEEHQKHVDELAKLSGKEFDKKYVSMMVDDHKDDVDAFEKEAKDAKDPELQAFASKTASVVKEHLGMIKTIHDNMK